jgi:hypothetical protein
MRRLLSAAPADEFYNLDVCVSFHASNLPKRFANDGTVQFDSDALRVHTEMQQHLTDIQTSGQLPPIAINGNFNSESHV